MRSASGRYSRYTGSPYPPTRVCAFPCCYSKAGFTKNSKIGIATAAPMGRSSYINPVKPGLFIFAVLLLLTPTADAQEKVRVSGRVYDMSQSNPLEAVSVESSSGGFTITDSLGRFSIIVNETDSIWFPYLQKPTPKYPVNTITNSSNFEIALHINMVQLKEVRIVPKNYSLDSIQNRKEYADAINYKKPGIGSALDLSPGGGVGLDINQLIEMFQF